ncbi:MAG: hypothetical protein Q8Q12_00925, partial [bacterium]|nr:hypothetical protein [bacterium]
AVAPAVEDQRAFDGVPPAGGRLAEFAAAEPFDSLGRNTGLSLPGRTGRQGGEERPDSAQLGQCPRALSKHAPEENNGEDQNRGTCRKDFWGDTVQERRRHL